MYPTLVRGRALPNPGKRGLTWTPRVGPAESSIFASPPPAALLSTASGVASTASVSPVHAAEPGRSDSVGYWSIHSSATAPLTRARSGMADRAAGVELVLPPGDRKPVLLASQAPAAPTGLAQALALSPAESAGGSELAFPRPAPRLAANRPSELAVALAPPAQRARARARARTGAAKDRLDLSQLRREQLARRRATGELDRGGGGGSPSASEEAQEGASDAGSAWEDDDDDDIATATAAERRSHAVPPLPPLPLALAPPPPSPPAELLNRASPCTGPRPRAGDFGSDVH